MECKHPDWNEILAHLEGGEADSELASHLSTCNDCSRKAEELGDLLAAFVAARLPAPPAALVEATLQRIREELAAAPAAGIADRLAEAIAGMTRALRRPLRECRATFVADSAKPSLQFRGGGGAAATRLYETEGYELIIGVSEAESGSAALRGQVIPKRGEALPGDGIALLGSTESVLESPVSELGEFRFDPAPVEFASLALMLGDELIRLDIDREER
jgi:hypothetical protein